MKIQRGGPGALAGLTEIDSFLPGIRSRKCLRMLLEPFLGSDASAWELLVSRADIFAFEANGERDAGRIQFPLPDDLHEPAGLVHSSGGMLPDVKGLGPGSGVAF